MTRGYLRDSGGAKRLRFVKSGYDADSESVPPNKVIFDSKDIGTLSLLDSGEYTWAGVNSTAGNTKFLTTVKSWDYDFVPLCSFQFSMANNGYFEPYLSSISNSSADNIIIVSKAGIFANFYWGYVTTVVMRWQAYRLAAA